MQIFSQRFKNEFKNKDKEEIFVRILKVGVVYVGVILVLLCVIRCAFNPRLTAKENGIFVYDHLRGFEYVILFSEKEIRVVDVINSSSIENGCLIIPETYLGYPITEISFSRGLLSYNGYRPINSVKLTDNITEISPSCFRDMDNIEHIYGGTNVRLIGNNAFAGAINLQSVELGDQLETIEWEAFMGCENLKEIKLGNRIEDIWRDAFRGCSNLEKVEIGYQIQKIDEGAFADCINLKEVVGCQYLSKVEQNSFSGTPWADSEEGQKIIRACTMPE